MSVCAGEASATAEDRHRATHLQREPAQDFRSVLNITNADTVPDLKKNTQNGRDAYQQITAGSVFCQFDVFCVFFVEQEIFPIFLGKNCKNLVIAIGNLFLCTNFYVDFLFPPPPPVSGL